LREELEWNSKNLNDNQRRGLGRAFSTTNLSTSMVKSSNLHKGSVEVEMRRREGLHGLEVEGAG
jgi:hypothetical protein